MVTTAENALSQATLPTEPKSPQGESPDQLAARLDMLREMFRRTEQMLASLLPMLASCPNPSELLPPGSLMLKLTSRSDTTNSPDPHYASTP